MFTSIAKLKASAAQPNRVALVEAFVTKHSPSWKPATLFPIAIVALSNSFADYNWVYGSSSATVGTAPDFGFPATVMNTTTGLTSRVGTRKEAEAQLRTFANTGTKIDTELNRLIDAIVPPGAAIAAAVATTPAKALPPAKKAPAPRKSRAKAPTPAVPVATLKAKANAKSQPMPKAIPTVAKAKPAPVEAAQKPRTRVQMLEAFGELMDNKLVKVSVTDTIIVPGKSVYVVVI